MTVDSLGTMNAKWHCPVFGGVYYLGRRRLEANPHKWVALQAFSDAHYQQSNDSCTDILYTDSQILLGQTIILLSLLK